jgi:3-oxoacyl-[acyl-carrier protein] reductase
LPYAAAKAGVLGLTFQLARDLGAWGITVNAVVPGFTLTEPGARVHRQFAELRADERRTLLDSLPLGRPGRPADVAAAVRYLVSDQAEYVSGAALEISGVS